jgi:hypothetical protein
MNTIVLILKFAGNRRLYQFMPGATGAVAQDVSVPDYIAFSTFILFETLEPTTVLVV